MIDAHATVLVLAREAQDDALVVAQASTLHEAGVRVRSLTAFYDEWLGKLPIAELERLSLMFDIAEVHESRYGRAKRLVDIVIGTRGVAVLAIVTPFVLLGNRIAEPRPAASTARRGSVGTGASSASASSARCARTTARCPTSGRPRTTRASRAFGRVAAAHATSTSCRRRRTSCAAISPSSVRARSSRTT